MSMIADHTPGGDTTPTPADPRPSFRTPTPRADQDTLTAAELAALFAPLRRDYALIVAATAHLPHAERAARVLPRVEAYSDALSATLVGALDDATALVRGERARGGVR